MLLFYSTSRHKDVTSNVETSDISNQGHFIFQTI